ncbi:MAG: PASTA domain-containing protein [Alistipes sp.]
MEKISYYWAKLKQKPLAYNLVLIVLTLVALGLVSHILMQTGTRHGARRTVPDFTGVLLDDAQRIARDNDLKLCVNDSLYVSIYEGGIVLDQVPEQGVEVKPGRTIYISINSFRQKMVSVPYVAQQSLRQAKNMLEIAGLEIEKLVYRPDIATNYVLSEFCKDKQVLRHSRIEAPMGSGITLYVGVAGGQGSTVVPRVIGFQLQQAKSRLWELGLNIGKITFDKGVSLLNQRQAHVYAQAPGQERSVALGATVDLLLTLDGEKTKQQRIDAEKAAKGLIEAREAQEKEKADSLALIDLEPTQSSAESTEPEVMTKEEGFFE